MFKPLRVYCIYSDVMFDFERIKYFDFDYSHLSLAKTKDVKMAIYSHRSNYFKCVIEEVTFIKNCSGRRDTKNNISLSYKYHICYKMLCF